MMTAVLIGAMFLASTWVAASEWPTYQHDTHRSGVTEEQLNLPLTQKWVYTSSFPPQPAWEGPAKWDSYSVQKDLKSMRNFDPVYHVTTVGDLLFFGSSVDDAAHCLDAVTGEERWHFFTEGPVRVAPTYFQGRVYFGSDDGCAYCVDAQSGALIWQYQASPQLRLVPSNGKLISLAPVRTGVLVKAGMAYFGASLLPWRPSYLCAVDAETGADDVDGAYRKEYKSQTLQGAMLASSDSLYALQGRSAPIMFNRLDGKRRRTIESAGGVFALLTHDDHLIIDSNNQKDVQFSEKDIRSRDKLAFYPDANRIVVSEGMAYLQSGNELSVFNRKQLLALRTRIIQNNDRKTSLEEEKKEISAQFKKDRSDSIRKKRSELLKKIKSVKKEIEELTDKQDDCFPWKVPCDLRHVLILAGDTLFAGGTNQVTAYDSSTGELLWEASVDGAAHGLAVANGRLFISTDRGHIYAFE